MTNGKAPAKAESRPKRLYQQLYFQVLLAILLGAAIGYFDPGLGSSLKPLGDAFIRLVKMIIAPVIFLTITTGIAGMRDLSKVGGVVVRALIYFTVFAAVALLLGLAVADLLRPGAGMNIDPATLKSAAVADYVAKAHDQTVVGFLMNIIPPTVVGAFASGDILQVLFFSVPFGIALAMIGERAQPAVAMLNSIADAFFVVVGIFMRAAPIGALGAFAFTIGSYGIKSIGNLVELIGAFYLTTALFVLVGLGTVAWFSGFSIFRLIGFLKEELLLVLGTSSSEAALPSLIDKLEVAGCPKSVVGVVVPLGYSFNLDGTNIYMTLGALFIAQALNIHLPLGQQLLLLAVAMLSSKGAAGVTGAGFITLAATLSVVPSIPVAGLALILGVDRFMSQCRAIANFIGNAVAAIVISAWEGSLDRKQLSRALRGEPPDMLTPEASLAARGERALQ